MQLFVAAAECQTQFVFQLLEVGQLTLHVVQLLFQPPPHWSTRLHAALSQLQKFPDLMERESESLHTTDKGERLEVVFAKSAGIHRLSVRRAEGARYARRTESRPR